VPKVRMTDGSFVDVGADALFADDGTTPFTPAPLSTQAVTGRVFSEEDVARIRQEEKDKLYKQLDENRQELARLNEQIGSLTAAEQRRQAQLEEEQQRLEAEARAQEEKDLDAKSLLERREQEWNSQLTSLQQTWEQRFEQSEEQRKAAEALAQREREFGDLRDYTLAAVEANKDKIAPQLMGWIGGNSKEEVDASIARAVETTDSIANEMQQMLGHPLVDPNQQYVQVGQPVPPLPGTRTTAGPTNVDPAGQQVQTLTAEQIANMPMDQYAALRSKLGIGGQGNNRGMFG
jgi:hypothetical protein